MPFVVQELYWSRFTPKRLNLSKLFGFKLILLLCIRLMKDLISQEHSINMQSRGSQQDNPISAADVAFTIWSSKSA